VPPKIKRVERLSWSDPDFGEVYCPAGPMRIRASFGSGLSLRTGDAPGVFWGVGDRGPNLKISTAIERYGLHHLRRFDDAAGAKLMPRLDIGPAIAELQLHEDRVELIRTIRLTGADGQPLSGVPTPAGDHSECEPAVGLDGELLAPDSRGADTEGIAALADGGFIIGDEYGPSLLVLDRKGRITARWVPGDPLPAIAAKRKLNRGFESLAVSPDEAWLYLAFQSPLAHPNRTAHEEARHVRIWRLDARTGSVSDQFLYPLDRPETFSRDCARGEFAGSDIKVSELAVEADGRLLVLERGSETTKIYRTRLDPVLTTNPQHLEIETRPTIEEISASGGDLPELEKELLFSTDDHPEVAADLEGMIIVSATELLLVSDNDFGVEGAETSFWRVRFEEPLLQDG
jgi:hypothetical protein